MESLIENIFAFLALLQLTTFLFPSLVFKESHYPHITVGYIQIDFP